MLGKEWGKFLASCYLSFESWEFYLSKRKLHFKAIKKVLGANST